MIASVKTQKPVNASEHEKAMRDFCRGNYRNYGIMRTDRAEMTEHEAASVASWLETIKVK